MGRTLPHWRPMWGSSDQGGTRKGCPKLHWSHQPRQRTATSAPAPPERQRRPAEERGGSAATTTGNRLQLASPGSSLEQPRPAAPLPGDQEPKAPCSRRRWGDHASSPWWRGVPIRTVPGPPRSYPLGPAVRPPPPSPSSQSLQPASPETPPPAEAAAPGLRSPGRRGRVGLACDTVGVGGGCVYFLFRYGNPVESPVCGFFFCLLGWGGGGSRRGWGFSPASIWCWGYVEGVSGVCVLLMAGLQPHLA